MTAKETWRENLPAEAAFWEDWVANNEKGQIRFAADFPFPDNARQALGEGLKEISALDLGSGPASTVGSYWPGHEVRLTYVDPLADEYNALLRRHGLDRFATIVKGSGETLREDVKPGFDYVHSGNALDHAHDPVLCIQNMIDVAKPGGINSSFSRTKVGSKTTPAFISGISIWWAETWSCREETGRRALSNHY